MKAFRFRLRTVLAARERTRDAARGRLAAALAEVRAAADRLAAAEAARADGSAELASLAATGRVDVDGWLDRRRHAAVLTTDVITARRAVAETESAAAAARREAAEAEAGVKALERLRDRDRAAYAKAAERADQRAAEESWLAARGASRGTAALMP